MTHSIKTTREHLFAINHKAVNRPVGSGKKGKGLCSVRDGPCCSEHTAMHKNSYQLIEMRTSKSSYVDRGNRKCFRAIPHRKRLLFSVWVKCWISMTIFHWKLRKINCSLTFSVLDQQKISSTFRGLKHLLFIFLSHCFRLPLLSKTLKNGTLIERKNCVENNLKGAIKWRLTL